MEMAHALWLAIIQGLTEFLPISSSGHLVLAPTIFGWPDQGLAFDISVHVGTLVAVVLYFRRDLAFIAVDWCKSIIGGPVTVYSKLAWAIAFATVFVGIAGIVFESYISTALRNPVPIGVATLFFGIVLGIADKVGSRNRSLEQIWWKDVIVIGVAQMLALIPGTSRSGITITAGLAMGLTRDAATRFSFLMALPVIALAGIWQGKSLLDQPQPVQWDILLAGALVSACIAILCIHYFLRYVQRFSLMPFVIYRIVLGVILMAVFM